MVVWIRLNAVVPAAEFSNAKPPEAKPAEAQTETQSPPEEPHRDDDETPPPVDPGR